MKNFSIAFLFLLTGIAVSATLNNGNITIEVDGDGDVGRVECDAVPGSNHVTLVGVNLHYDSELHDVDYIPGTEKNYTGFSKRKMFTGYGRDTDSNFYVYSVSYIEGSNSNLDQTLIYTMRKNAQLKMSYTVDSRVMQTDTNDHGSFNIANQTLTFDEEGIFLGFAARLNGSKTTTHIYSGFSEVLTWLQNASSTITEVQNYINAAGAVAWGVASVNGTPQVVQTKIMVASTDGEIQSMSSFAAETPVYVPESALVEITKAKFTQKFKKTFKDSVKIKGKVNISKYGTLLDNLGNLDVSLFIGDYIAFTPNDNSQIKAKTKKIIHKLKDVNGVRKLIVKTKNKHLEFSFTASKTDFSGGSMLTANTQDAKDSPMMLPMTLVLTGNNSQDTEKGEKVFVIPASVNMVYTKKNDKKVAGKLAK